MSLIKNVLKSIYSGMTQTRHLLYQNGILNSVQVSCPVISVGNLTVGGTGKTPIIDYLLILLKKNGHQPGLVSRSYKAEAKHPERIDLHQPRAAIYYGDEPTMLALKHPDIPVYVGQSKSDAALRMTQQENIDVLLVDDGFQHLRLKRDLDIVILDATESFANYQLLPVGRAREGWEALQRASGIFITKTNLVEAEHLKILKTKLDPVKPIFEFAYQIKSFKELRTGKVRTADEFTGSALGFCGIARPETFQKIVTQSCRHLSLQVLHFSDHHGYANADLEKILSAKEQHGANFIFTTEKDAIKLKESWPQDQELWVVELELQPQDSEKLLYEFISQIFH